MIQPCIVLLASLAFYSCIIYTCIVFVLSEACKDNKWGKTQMTEKLFPAMAIGGSLVDIGVLTWCVNTSVHNNSGIESRELNPR